MKRHELVMKNCNMTYLSGAIGEEVERDILITKESEDALKI